MVRTPQLNHSSHQATTTTSMYSVSNFQVHVVPAVPATATSISNHTHHPRWHLSDLQYRELVAMYMDFVDHAESTTGKSPVDPHLNPKLIEQVFARFSRVAPRDCILRKLKDCHTLEELHLVVSLERICVSVTRPHHQVNIRHRNQWDILKVQRMKDQIVNYQHQLTLVKLVPPLKHHTSQIIHTITGKIEERQRCLQLHPSRYYRPGP